MTSRVVSLSVVLLTVAGTAPAQSIPIHTVPLVPADQFDIFPSDALAMGEVSIALPDTLHDPLVNPAKGARLRVARLFSSPTIYGVSHDAGSGRTLPMGVFTPGAAWYGGLALAVQQVDASQPSSSFFNPPSPLAGGLGSTTPDLGPGPLSHGNTLGFAMIGRNLRESGLSVGASVRWAKLRAVDGVDLLYPGSTRVDQSGATVAARLGVLKEWAGDRSFEAVVLHDRFKMTHDVTFVDAFWDPGAQQFFQRSRLEHNRDFTKQWGLQVKYERPLTASGWRIGWLATANRTSQPNTPSSDLLNIPQDPGRAAAYELGVGVSRILGPSAFGIDVVYQPIWSSTWAVAETPTATSRGDSIPVGGRTVDNGFHFSNGLFRMGVSREVALGPLTKTAALQLGLVVRAVHYALAQQDHIEAVTRRLVESWVEWTPTWGLSLRFPDLELRYRGRVTHGTDRLVATPDRIIAFADQRSVGFFPPPGASPTLDGVHVVTHQFSVSLPLR